MKIKEFVEKNEKAIKIAGAVVVVTASGLIGYKIGKKVGLDDFMHGFDNDLKNMTKDWFKQAHRIHTIRHAGDVMLVEDLEQLAKEAIKKIDPSELNSKIIGVLVFENP